MLCNNICPVLYVFGKCANLLSDLSLIHASLTREHVKNACDVVSTLVNVQSLQVSFYCAFFLHSPMDRFPTSISHIITKGFLGSHAYHTHGISYLIC